MQKEWEERHRNREGARDAFLLAAAALTQMPDDQTLGFAVVNGAVGLLLLAKADHDNRGLDNALARLDAMRVTE